MFCRPDISKVLSIGERMIDSGERLRKLVLSTVRLSGLSWISKHFLGGMGAILTMHRVTATPEPGFGFNSHLSITPDFLDRLLADMKAEGFVFVSIDEAMDRIATGTGGERFATVTLDDGYRDNLLEALPVFEKHEVPFSVFIAPGLIEGAAELWWDLVEAVVTVRDRLALNTSNGRVYIDCSTPAKKAYANCQISDYLTCDIAEEDQIAIVRDLASSAGVDYAARRQDQLMTWDEIRRLAGHPLCTIGAHTVHHHNLKRLPVDKALKEMSDSALILELELGETPRHLAYPYGYPAAVGEREAEIAQAAGFVSGLTTRHGMIQPEHARHMHALPRMSVNGRYQKIGYMSAMLSGVTTPIANGGRKVVTV